MNHTDTDTAAVTAVRALLDGLTDAWNRGDGAAYGARFTDDATYVTYIGTVYRGGDEIGAAHQALFDSFLKGTRLASEVDGIRFYGPDVAVVITRGDTYKGTLGKLTKVQTYTVIRQANGEWRVAAFQNTKHKSLMEAFNFTVQPGARPQLPR
ncbi:SgcJ/EcaC family oxidoreductase [Streptomyces sp. P1-3]|uniref:SgcJ/EcaC family oxidoreductase n=1 Tax=Streptomyces sp. P1-3 TaxID=3421658 RepID=UPI003D366E58